MDECNNELSMRQGLKTKMSFRNGFPRGFLNSGAIEVPEIAFQDRRLQSAVEPYLDVSVEEDTNVFLEQISERMQDTGQTQSGTPEVGLPVVEVLDDSLPSEDLRG